MERLMLVLFFSTIFVNIESTDRCPTEPIPDVFHNPFNGSNVFLIYNTTAFEYSLISQNLVGQVEIVKFWPEVKGVVTLGASTFHPKGFPLIAITTTEFMHLYICHGNLSNCKLDIHANLSEIFKTLEAGFFYQFGMVIHSHNKVVASKDNYRERPQIRVYFSDGLQADCLVAGQPKEVLSSQNFQQNCTRNDEVILQYPNLLKLRGKYSGKLRGISTWFSDKTREADFVIVGDEHVVYTHDSEFHTKRIDEIFGCFPLTFYLIFVAIFLLGILILLKAATTYFLLYKSRKHPVVFELVSSSVVTARQ